ncbi:lipase family protein [Tsukamurella sp. 8F]|uniref:lipase family protein n=1 Tax=unclassified Tsukamurella TaxID=2633480 RepID=UPI0023B96C00|nr:MULTISPECIES: lipase family protein [unclassified Tsukamurella]MDF0529351.1 lipase family protein [Tsukamurella sp. 8J]MDF0587142.1 lipase family protein [Tsukamurella sp. 8F]
MRGRVRALLVLAMVSTLAFCIGAVDAITVPATARAEPAPPRDSFYDVPADLAHLDPGAIVRTRSVQVKSLGLFHINADAWQIAYRTSGQHREPDMAVTTVMVPRGTKPTKLLSFQSAADATLRVCNPSYQLTKMAPAGVDLSTPAGPLLFDIAPDEVLFAALGLREGWAVTMPDHGGIENRFLTPHQPGYAVLDGIRAVEHFRPANVTRSSPVTMWGYSDGGIVSSWAAEEQPTYAPELTQIKGAAMGAVERDLPASLKDVNGSLIGGFIPIGLGAIGKDSAQFARAIDKYLTPNGKARVDATHDHCLIQNIMSNLWLDYRNDFLTAPLDTVLEDPVVRKAIRERGITGRAPRMPLYVYNGVTDEISPIAGEDKLVHSYCAGGTSVVYRREQFPPNPVPQLNSPHVVVAVTGAAAAFNWVKDRMNGVPAQAGCDTKTVPATLLDPGALSTLGGAFGTILSMIAGAPVKP